MFTIHGSVQCEKDYETGLDVARKAKLKREGPFMTGLRLNEVGNNYLDQQSCEYMTRKSVHYPLDS